MVTTGGNGNGIVQALDIDEGISAISGAAELAEHVGAPTADGSVCEKRAGVLSSRRNSDCVVQALHGDGSMAIRRGAIAKSTSPIIAPALRGTSREERTGMKTAGRNGDSIAKPLDDYGTVAVNQSTVAELTTTMSISALANRYG